MEECKTFLNKLVLKTSMVDSSDKKPNVFVQSKWFKDYVDFIFQGGPLKETFRGQLTHKEFEESAIDLDISFEEFYSECKAALTTALFLPGFEYEIDLEEKTFKLYKKKSFLIQYLEMSLWISKNNDDMLDSAISLIETLQNKIAQCEKSSQEVLERHEAMAKKYLTEKNEQESKLLTKVSMLINSKKRQIDYLNNLLNEHNKDVNIGGATPDDISMLVESHRSSKNETETGSLQNTVNSSIRKKKKNELPDTAAYDIATQLMTPDNIDADDNTN